MPTAVRGLKYIDFTISYCITLSANS